MMPATPESKRASKGKKQTDAALAAAVSPTPAATGEAASAGQTAFAVPSDVEASWEVQTNELLAINNAEDRDGSHFDYIIVGSGAGGGPLASRLAEKGKKVLVLEAGSDPVIAKADAYPTAEKGEVTKVPGYYAAASEDKELSWMFSVRHHAKLADQQRDEKYSPQRVERVQEITPQRITTKAGAFPGGDYALNEQTQFVNEAGTSIPPASIHPDALITVYLAGGGGSLAEKVVLRDAKTALERTILDPNSPVGVKSPLAAKYLDPHPKGGKQGVFYPRSSGVGGCTAHHAMITIAPNDKDWDYIAELTGDDSWRAGPMRGYFAKFENNQYLKAYRSFLRTVLGFFYEIYRWFVLLVNPRAMLDKGGHGFKGWAPTNFIDPFLIKTIAKTDQPFLRAIVEAAIGTLHQNSRWIAMLKTAALRFRVLQAIDFNDLNTRRAKPEGVFLIPIGVEGERSEDEQKEPGTGRRFGVREFLLKTRRQHPDKLVIKTRVHVTRVLFENEKDEDGKLVPRAIGVECAPGEHLYEASPKQQQAGSERVCYFVRKQRGEVILCGGAFNTPQLLMLSGIGDREHLEEHKITTLTGVSKTTTATGETSWQAEPLAGSGVINLPGVGANLQDRYEVTVVSELNADLATLDGVSFLPGDNNDPARRQWLQEKSGLYTTNGGTLAVIRRSQAAIDEGWVEPDLFTFGAPAAFRGYYWNWSRELFKDKIGGEQDLHRLWSWVILKAYTRNHHGLVRLRSASPFDMPEICFDAFNEKAEGELLVLRPKKAALEEVVKKAEEEGNAVSSATREALIEVTEQIKLNESRIADSKRDLEALVDAVAFMRKVNAYNPDQFVREVQPGTERQDSTDEMREWVRGQAWGHHASCTCRIGSDPWRRDVKELRDECAVLDSRFQVHGVRGLRVVDASVFPKIPGYFILAPIFMVSEKAADTLLQDATSSIYPQEFRDAELAAINLRREIAHRGEPLVAAKAGEMSTPKAATPEPNKVVTAPTGEASAQSDEMAAEARKKKQAETSANTVGLALSGGGIRSATFALGVLQTLAERNRIRDIDYLSTVSGGGFIGSFLGRLFTRPTVTESKDPAGRVQEILKNTSSAQLWWLRTQANYIFATGTADLRANLAVFFRNILTIYLVLGSLLLALFGFLAWLPQAAGGTANRLGWFRLRGIVEQVLDAPSIGQFHLSIWWWLPVLVLVGAVLPLKLGYWLAPMIGSYRAYPIYSLFGWLVLLTGTLVAVQIPHAFLYAGVAALVLALAWVWQEVLRWGTQSDECTESVRRRLGAVIRNRITRTLGEALFIFAGLAAFVVLDSFARLFAENNWHRGVAIATATLLPLQPLLRELGLTGSQKLSLFPKKGVSLLTFAGSIGLPLALFLLFAVDVFAQRLLLAYPGLSWGIVVVGILALFSLVIGRAFDFLNSSSLHSTYGARLARTFLGASNEARVYPAPGDDGRNVEQAHVNDDVPFHQYHPEEHGGPLHIINVCVNETVDFASSRDIRERRGLPMSVTPHGVSVGRRYFALWTKPDALPLWQKLRRWLEGFDGEDAEPFVVPGSRLVASLLRKIAPPAEPEKRPAPADTALRALPTGADPNAFNPLKTTQSESAEVEILSLSAWTAISGAAFSTGLGRDTRLPVALFMGLVNVRLGYWWDSGIQSSERPGQYPPNLWQRLKRLPVSIFRMQSMLLSEFRARFTGPSRWFWYLSDGGHFEVTGMYELLRRRVKFIIVTDAGEDPKYQWSDLALLTQQAREDFGAQVVWLNPDPKDGKRLKDWAAFADPEGKLPPPPDWVKDWIDPEQLGPIGKIRKDNGTYHAALARVTYDGSEDTSWILLIKPSVSDNLTEDIINYAKLNDTFPQQPTFDQVFDDLQWESYRALGQQIADNVLADKETVAANKPAVS